MNYPILSENQKKRLDKPLWELICFAMFCFWQMGFIYFIGPSLTVNGRTPLPISMDNATVLIAVCYVLSILWMIFMSEKVIWTQRIVTGAALLTAVGLFLPLPDNTLRFLVYAQIFCCCLMIGFETFIMVNFFSEESNVKHLTAAYGVSLILIAAVQNDFVPISFPTFRFITVAALIPLLIFFLRMPAQKEALPVYVKKEDDIAAPKHLLIGAYVLVFICALMGVSGPAISGEVSGGVFITYMVDAIASFVLFFLYKKLNIHPFRVVPIFVGVGGVGFLLILASAQVPFLAYIACGLIGIGMVPCQMLPLYGASLMKVYPSKYISPVIIGLALGAVLVQGSMVEAFRSAPTMLYLVYAIVMAVLVLVYMQIEPFFLFGLRKGAVDATAWNEDKEETETPVDKASDEEVTALDKKSSDPLDVLTPKEREVAELICLGYTNGDIAKLLFISEHTVKDHTKKIYPKMGVHSRLELAAIVSKHRAGETK